MHIYRVLYRILEADTSGAQRCTMVPATCQGDALVRFLSSHGEAVTNLELDSIDQVPPNHRTRGEAGGPRTQTG